MDRFVFEFIQHTGKCNEKDSFNQDHWTYALSWLKDNQFLITAALNQMNKDKEETDEDFTVNDPTNSDAGAPQLSFD